MKMMMNGMISKEHKNEKINKNMSRDLKNLKNVGEEKSRKKVRKINMT